ncbi:hypothetical protein, partial [Proteus vulgaris]
MTQKENFKHLVKSIESKEVELNLWGSLTIEKTLEIIKFLQLILIGLKENILKNGFQNQLEEINFFKIVKPHILSKLIFY